MPDESVEVRVARLDERYKALEEKCGEDRTQIAAANEKLGTIKTDLDRVLSRQALFTPEQVHTLSLMLDAFQEDSADQKEFGRSIRISVITMVASVLLFSVVVPLLQHLIH